MDIVKQTNIPETGWTQHYDVLRELGDCYVSVGEYDKARECYDEAVGLAPDEAAPYIGFGVIAMQTGELADAETAFKVARRLDPKCSKAYCGLAMICQNRSDAAGAFDLYLKSLETDSDNLTALLGLFQLSCAMGSFSKVIYYLEIYLDAHPGDITVMFCLATLHLKDKQPHKARELLLNILALDANNKDASDLLEEAEHILAQECRS
ncbi:MAG TPA: tetratricopeptide repeat protein [Planctomycetes bacterium]|nr:tetratricopeptide repeat protein [Planctomycetota bacterium]HIJ70285.1 tetratricopeptide repeat protein [Planctomycetota bacterium]